jgi:RNA:NAD 2'-phosphotransferase (TPT1/KptA family)
MDCAANNGILSDHPKEMTPKKKQEKSVGYLLCNILRSGHKGVNKPPLQMNERGWVPVGDVPKMLGVSPDDPELKASLESLPRFDAVRQDDGSIVVKSSYEGDEDDDDGDEEKKVRVMHLTMEGEEFVAAASGHSAQLHLQLDWSLKLMTIDELQTLKIAHATSEKAAKSIDTQGLKPIGRSIHFASKEHSHLLHPATKKDAPFAKGQVIYTLNPDKFDDAFRQKKFYRALNGVILCDHSIEMKYLIRVERGEFVW